MKTQIAFYKAPGTWKDKLIKFWTRSKYSHCELVIGNEWYSSSDRDNGVRKKIMNSYNPEHWDFIDVEVDVLYALSVFNKHKGKGYDWMNIVFTQWLPLGLHSKRRMICSEFVAEVLGWEGAHMYSPKDVYVKLNNSLS